MGKPSLAEFLCNAVVSQEALGLAVRDELTPNDIFVDSRSDVFLQAIGNRHHEVIHPVVLDEPRQEGSGLTAVLVS
jgi:hypothetical protein